MVKSRLYKKIKEGTTFEELYNNKEIYFNKRCNIIEFVHKFNFTEDILKLHPCLHLYEICCVGYNGECYFIGTARNEDYNKKEGFFWFSYSGNSKKIPNIFEDTNLLYNQEYIKNIL